MAFLMSHLHFNLLLFLVVLFSFYSNDALSENICQHSISTNSSGTLTDSGGSSGRYQNNEVCTFLIQSNTGDITLSFRDFNYENFFDTLRVYDGTSSRGVLLGSFTGSSLPSDVTASSGAMYIVHQSDFFISADGFVATWSTNRSTVLSQPVAEWHFDEQNWLGESGEVVDNFNYLNGVAVNGAATVAGGQVCRSAKFDGVDDYLDIDGIDTYLKTTSSLSFWMKTTPVDNRNYWEAPGISGIEQANRSSDDIFWGYMRGDGRLGFGRGGSHHVTSPSRSIIFDDSWHHVVLTRDSPSGELQIYIDGVRVISGIGRVGDVPLSFSSLGRIEDTGGTPAYFSGELDEVLIFDRVINDNEVLSIYNNQSRGNNWDGSPRDCDPEIVAEWQFEEESWNGSTNEVVDSSGNGHHARLFLNAFPRDLSPAIPTRLVDGSGSCRYGSFSSGSVAVEGLPVDTRNGAKTTVTFWMRWDGTNGSMPIGWDRYDLWFFNGSFGFNTWSNDVYGINSAPLRGGWHHIAAEFTNGSSAVTANRLWVDGVEQTLTQQQGRPSSFYRSVGSRLRIGGAITSSFYRFHGDVDEVKVYNASLVSSQVINIMRERHPCFDDVASYFSIAHDNAAVYCLDESISVSARNGDQSVFANYADTVTLDTQTGSGSWSLVKGHGRLTDSVADDGVATYTFDAADNGEAKFSLYYPEGNNTVNIDVYETGGSDVRDDDTEGNIIFSSTGFSVTASALSNPPVLPIAHPFTTKVSGEDFSVHIAAYGNDPDSGQCGIIETYSGQKKIQLSTQYINPLSGALEVSGSGDVSFVNGQASLSARYDDAGQISVVVTDTDENIQGASNHFVVKPERFSITALGNPSTTASGSGFSVAGMPFTVNVQALNAQGQVTPNYGNELLPESVAVSIDSLTFPTGGNVGELSNATSFVKNSVSNTFENSVLAWSEVGSMTLLANVADGDYLGEGDIVSAASDSIGRFYPDRFQLNHSQIINSHSNFTYLSQPELTVSYELAAVNSDGVVVTNYDSGLGYPAAATDYHIESNDAGINLNSRFFSDSATWSAGLYHLHDDEAVLLRSTNREAPMSAVFGVRVLDSLDGRLINNRTINAGTVGDCSVANSCLAAELGQATFYYGRVILPSAYGPESADLPATLFTEYWDGQKFLLHRDDNGTKISRDNITLNAAPINVDSHLSVDLSGGVTMARFESLDADSVQMVAGDAGLNFSSPGLGISDKSFTVEIDLLTMPWLRYDWNQDGDDNNDTALPIATMSFQSYRGHDRILYWRHRFD